MDYDPDIPLEPDPNDPSLYMECRFDFKPDGLYVNLNDLARYFAVPRWEGPPFPINALGFSQLLLDLESFMIQQRAFIEGDYDQEDD